MPGKKKSVPNGSRRRICSLIVVCPSLALGSFSIKNMIPSVRPPIGRLMKKHHLQVTFVVNRPDYASALASGEVEMVFLFCLTTK